MQVSLLHALMWIGTHFFCTGVGSTAAFIIGTLSGQPGLGCKSQCPMLCHLP
jgi:hypothetical protein